jgi:hypothetical protein
MSTGMLLNRDGGRVTPFANPGDEVTDGGDFVSNLNTITTRYLGSKSLGFCGDIWDWAPKYRHKILNF